MPDRSTRLLRFPQPSAQPWARDGERGGVYLRERPASPPDTPPGGQDGGEGRGGSQEDNPFAPPPEGTPDRPWQPRRPSGDGGDGDGSRGRSPWGRQWSDRQPGRSGGGFGDRPGAPGPGQDGPGGGSGTGPRWDPTDPVQRRARYALLCGMWAFFFALFSWPYVALVLGALALHWGIATLRAKPRTPGPDETPAPEQSGRPPQSGRPQQTGRPQRTAAISGLVMGSLSLVLVAATFTAQLVYDEYYTCTSDALTHQSKEACNDLLPSGLRTLLGTGE